MRGFSVPQSVFELLLNRSGANVLLESDEFCVLQVPYMGYRLGDGLRVGLAAATRLTLGALLGSEQHLTAHHKADRLKEEVYSYFINQSWVIVGQPAAEKARLVFTSFL